MNIQIVIHHIFQLASLPRGVFAITLITSKRTSAAAIVVSSALVSYAGATSTISAETMKRPSSPRRIVRNSRVDQPPVSGVPVAGANAGSMESISIER